MTARQAPGERGTRTLYRQQIRVYFEDTDAGGIVYHASWLRFFERCRTDWLRSLGLSQAELARTQGLGFVVRALRIEYLRPARLDDLLSLDLHLAELRRASLSLSQQAFLDAPGEHQPVVSAQVRIAAVHLQSGRAVALPAPLRASLSPLSKEFEEHRVHAN